MELHPIVGLENDHMISGLIGNSVSSFLFATPLAQPEKPGSYKHLRFVDAGGFLVPFYVKYFKKLHVCGTFCWDVECVNMRVSVLLEGLRVEGSGDSVVKVFKRDREHPWMISALPERVRIVIE